jgi:hypothetical protein
MAPATAGGNGSVAVTIVTLLESRFANDSP